MRRYSTGTGGGGDERRSLNPWLASGFKGLEMTIDPGDPRDEVHPFWGIVVALLLLALSDYVQDFLGNLLGAVWR